MHICNVRVIKVQQLPADLLQMVLELVHRGDCFHSKSVAVAFGGHFPDEAEPAVTKQITDFVIIRYRPHFRLPRLLEPGHPRGGTARGNTRGKEIEASGRGGNARENKREERAI